MKIVDRTGQRISDRFLITKVLGHGGMGTVYLAHDERKHRDVALKVLHEELREKDWIVARFAREVDFLRTLSHPNVVDLIDAGYEGRMLYFTMEYIQGYNLREWMYRQGPMDFASVVHILCLVSKGLNYIHSRYIHRDIAPGVPVFSTTDAGVRPRSAVSIGQSRRCSLVRNLQSWPGGLGLRTEPDVSGGGSGPDGLVAPIGGTPGEIFSEKALRPHAFWGMGAPRVLSRRLAYPFPSS